MNVAPQVERRLNRWKYMTREAEVEMREEKRKRREEVPPK